MRIYNETSLLISGNLLFKSKTIPLEFNKFIIQLLPSLIIFLCGTTISTKS